MDASRFRTYPAYKDSGVGWLGQIPAHWEVRRLKTIASVQLSSVDKKSVEGEEPAQLCNYTDVYYNERITDNLDFMAATATPEQIRRFALRKGDVLITKDSESWTDIAVPAVVAKDLPGVLCGYHLAHIRPEPDCEGAFLARAFAAIGLRDQFQIAANGITRFGLDSNTIRIGLFAIPPVGEQRTIAAFLDRETAKIDALVAKKERLIELLQEKRAALISHAVTKGLDPTVPMKDSGVEWLGEIPAHWEVKRLKFSLKCVEQGWSPSCLNRTADPEEWGVLKVGCVNGTEFNPEEHKALPVDLSPMPELEIMPGDILMSRANTRELLGSVAVVEAIRHKLLLCDKLYRLKIMDQAVNRRFLVLALNSAISRFQLERDATGASGSMQNIAQDTVRNTLLPFPPVREQETIARALDRETAKLDALIAKVREGIEKLKEYRTALISAAVTGKIDVRALCEMNTVPVQYG